MRHLNILLPLMPYVLLALGLLSTLMLFAALKREIRLNAGKHKRRIDEMVARLVEAERAPTVQVIESTAFVPTQPRSGWNVNKRVHAMRLLRRGEDISHIAAALSVPRKEVELLIRVQQISRTRAIAPVSSTVSE